MWKILACLAFVGVISAVTDKQYADLANQVKTLKEGYDNLLKGHMHVLNLYLTMHKNYDAFKKEFDVIQKSSKIQKINFQSLARQVSLQRLYAEEVTRASGDSGLKRIRLSRMGSKSYFNTGFNGPRILSIHDHSDYKDTVGMGEFIAVLNGVEFRTRHNDYKMVMPSRNTKEYGKTQPVPFPDVPPQVLSKPTLDEQIKELREWFKAWKNSDRSKRDYRKYFKANLCYLEGMWTSAKSGQIDEPFASDRHSIEAKSFFQLQEKIAYTSATGSKSLQENLAFLPSKITEIDEYGNVKYSQWNYKILCHPLKRDVPLTRFRLTDDLGIRVAEGRSLDNQLQSRNARFSLFVDNRDVTKPRTGDEFVGPLGRFMDLLMSEIPGKDNYLANIRDNSFNLTAYPAGSNLRYGSGAKPLNVGYYHNAYTLNSTDAMGTAFIRRGFSDANLYVAFNTRDKIPPVKLEHCVRNYKCSYVDGKVLKKCSYELCSNFLARVSYAIPMEIIYTTPLQSWNPYNLKYHKLAGNPLVLGTDGKYVRNGGKDAKIAYNGISSFKYYMTPHEFFTDERKTLRDAADTVRGTVGVLDPNGKVRTVGPSGIAIQLKNIPGVGALRTRFPVMPIHEAGNNIYKELDALKDMTLLPHKYSILYPDSKIQNGTMERVFTFELNATARDPPGLHSHNVDLTLEDLRVLKSGKHVTVYTTTDNGHAHKIQIFKCGTASCLYMTMCDDKPWKCWDGHYGGLVCRECRFDAFEMV